MDLAATYLLSAIRVGKASFVLEHPLGFLVKRPTALPTDRPPALADDFTDAIGFETTVYNTGPVRDTSRAAVEDKLDPSAWIALAVAKREGNPYPERIGIGRARNCDVVLRYASVSKLHAHLHVESGRVVRLTDNRSSNGTWVNTTRVTAGPVAVKYGDTLRFGVLKLEYVDAETFHAWLTRSGSTPDPGR